MLRRFLSTPGMIGSIAPSSSALVEAMTRQISDRVAVFELGAGTGVITRHIQRIAPRASLLVFEQDHQLAAQLRRQIGQTRVIEGLFHVSVDGLDKIPDALLIVSSLPFKSLPDEVHEKTVAAICALLLASPNRRLIQYTYFDRPPFHPRHPSLRWRRLSRVWANIPPATVWELRVETGSANGRTPETERTWQGTDQRQRGESIAAMKRAPSS